MSYLKFDKNLMINLEQSLAKEMLRTNQSGAYHCTTIVGCNTRKQHGLLVIPIPEMDDNSHVLTRRSFSMALRLIWVCTVMVATPSVLTATSISASMIVSACPPPPIVWVA